MVKNNRLRDSVFLEISVPYAQNPVGVAVVAVFVVVILASRHFVELKKLCLSPSQILKRSGIELKPIIKNLVDEIWTDRPKPKDTRLSILDVKYTGMFSFCIVEV